VIWKISEIDVGFYPRPVIYKQVIYRGRQILSNPFVAVLLPNNMTIIIKEWLQLSITNSGFGPLKETFSENDFFLQKNELFIFYFSGQSSRAFRCMLHCPWLSKLACFAIQRGNMP